MLLVGVIDLADERQRDVVVVGDQLVEGHVPHDGAAGNIFFDTDISAID